MTIIAGGADVSLAKAPKGNIVVSGGGGSGIGIPREVKNGVYQTPTTSFTFSLPSEATDISDYNLAYAFYYCTGLTSVDLSSLTTISGNSALYATFSNCTGLISADLSSLTTVPGTSALYYAFNGCSKLTSVDLSALTSVSKTYGLSYTFSGCSKLTNIDLSSLTTLSGGNCLSYAFSGCTRLTDIYFRALTTSSFGSNKNQFGNMMGSTGSTVTHTLHFPSNMESTISDLTGYPLFGGTSGYVVLAYDLPATS